MSGDDLPYQDDYVREELINGEIVAMSPNQTINHHRISDQIFAIFNHYLRGRKCIAFSDGVDLYLGDKDRFIPDMMVVCDQNKIKWDGIYGAPDLVVEVLSPGTAKRDRGIKLQTYQKYGVLEYWIVIPDNRSVEQYLLQDGAFVLNEVYTLYQDYALKKMTPEQKAAALAPIKCSLYDDLEIDIKDIFNGLLQIV